ncbi:MAG: hypothetical protein AAB358_03815 [Patescibacteria group bacterium]
MPKITNEIAWLIDVYRHESAKPIPEDVAKIKLSQLVSKLGFFYEKIRNAIEYNEEHLIRRNSVERILRRQILFLMEKDPVKISTAIIHEFIRARYLPNDALPETIIDELSKTIGKYLTILSKLPNSQKLSKWIVGIAACEINDQLNPIEKEMAVANLMYSHLVDNLHFTKNHLNEKEKNLQIYLAVLRTLLKADSTTLRFALLKLYLPNWTKNEPTEIENFCQNFSNVRNKIEKNIAHPLGFQLSRAIRPQSVFFNVLREMLDKNKEKLEEIFTQPEILAEKIKAVAQENYQKVRSKLVGTIFRVIIYILFTKTILAFILELPYDYIFIGVVNWQALTINVIFHPVLMFIIAMTIRVPGAKNTQIIINEIKKIVYGEERKLVFKPKGLMKRGSTSFFVFNAIYLVMFAVSFGIILAILKNLHFNLISGVLFIFFLTIVSFFGFRLRNIAKQFSVIPRKDNLANFIVDFVSLPVIRVGRFFSTNFSRINIFLYILDFIIETPFKALVEFLEGAVSFINEKREEIND